MFNLYRWLQHIVLQNEMNANDIVSPIGMQRL